MPDTSECEYVCNRWLIMADCYLRDTSHVVRIGRQVVSQLHAASGNTLLTVSCRAGILGNSTRLVKKRPPSWRMKVIRESLQKHKGSHKLQRHAGGVSEYLGRSSGLAVDISKIDTYIRLN